MARKVTTHLMFDGVAEEARNFLTLTDCRY